MSLYTHVKLLQPLLPTAGFKINDFQMLSSLLHCYLINRVTGGVKRALGSPRRKGPPAESHQHLATAGVSEEHGFPRGGLTQMLFVITRYQI